MTDNAQETVLITGGAGFIGKRLIPRLAAVGHRIVVADLLIEQVHGRNPEPGLPRNVEFHRIDVAAADAMDALMEQTRPSLVYHLAAETGTGQSMDELVRYCHTNVTGTAVLLEALARHGGTASTIVLAGSRAIYGEGAWQTPAGECIVPEPRDPDAMRAGRFDCELEGSTLVPIATPEDLPSRPSSVYASTKLMQEHLVAQAAAVHGWRTRILRFQNVYGDGQSLSNPYTGVLSIFTRQIAEGRRLNIYEDGRIVRDFVYVDDVAEALARCADPALPAGLLANIGSGEPTTIMQVGQMLLELLGADPRSLDVTGDFRVGDIRHATADISRARDLLGWTPKTPLREGLRRLVDWARTDLAPSGH